MNKSFNTKILIWILLILAGLLQVFGWLSSEGLMNIIGSILLIIAILATNINARLNELENKK